MISAQDVAMALGYPLASLPDARLDIFVLALVIALLFAVNWAAFAVSLDELWEQAVMEEIASSSYFLHLIKAFLHFLSCLVISCDSDAKEHFFSDCAAVFKELAVQQLHASDVLVAVAPIVLFKHKPADSLKVVTKVSHSDKNVVFG